MSHGLDEKDYQILTHLQADARITNIELARRVELSPPGLQKRLRKLEEIGIIKQYTALINRELLGFDLLCFAHVTLHRHEQTAVENFSTTVQNIPEVLECFQITGEYDYILKVVVRNRKHLKDFLVETLTPIPGVDRIRTSVVLSDIKATTAVPVDQVYG